MKFYQKIISKIQQITQIHCRFQENNKPLSEHSIKQKQTNIISFHTTLTLVSS